MKTLSPRISFLTQKLRIISQQGWSVARRFHLWQWMIAAPMALLIIYLAVFSQPRFVSESKVAVKRPNEIDSASLNVGLLLGASNPSSVEDSLYLKEYINSPDMLLILDKQLNFHQAFGHSGWDFLYHLPQHISQEQFLDYYRQRLTVDYD